MGSLNNDRIEMMRRMREQIRLNSLIGRLKSIENALRGSPIDSHFLQMTGDQILKNESADLAGVEGSPQHAYCRAITREGTRHLEKAEYDELVRNRGKYHMFIDGMTCAATSRDGSGKPQTTCLTSWELAILIDFIEASKPMRPFSTKTGGNCLSRDSACRLFERARKKVDVKLDRYRYRAFRLCKDARGPNLKAFEFAPPHDLEYCLIVPV